MATTNSVDNNMFSSLMSTRDLSKFTLMRGVTDYANLEAYNLPRFLGKSAGKSARSGPYFDNRFALLEAAVGHYGPQ